MVIYLNIEDFIEEVKIKRDYIVRRLRKMIIFNNVIIIVILWVSINCVLNIGNCGFVNFL